LIFPEMMRVNERHKSRSSKLLNGERAFHLKHVSMAANRTSSEEQKPGFNEFS